MKRREEAIKEAARQFGIFLVGALLNHANDGLSFARGKKGLCRKAMDKYACLCILDGKMREKWTDRGGIELFFRDPDLSEGTFAGIFSERDWTPETLALIREQEWMKRNPDGILWLYDGNDIIVEDGFLDAFMPYVDINALKNAKLPALEQGDVYRMLREADDQEFYARGRRFLIENPFKQMEFAAWKKELEQNGEDERFQNLISAAYDSATGGIWCAHSDCGWLNDAGSERCAVCGRLLDRKNMTDELGSRLKAGVMRYIAKPGKLELKIGALLEKHGVKHSWWPDMDRCDFRAELVNGRVLSLDAKDFRANPKRSLPAAARAMAAKRDLPGEKLIVIDNGRLDRDDLKRVNHVPETRIITLKELEDIIGRK